MLAKHRMTVLEIQQAWPAKLAELTRLQRASLSAALVHASVREAWLRQQQLPQLQPHWRDASARLQKVAVAPSRTGSGSPQEEGSQGEAVAVAHPAVPWAKAWVMASP